MTTLLETGQRTRESGVKGLIRRHPLMAFFTLATATSWIVWLPYILSSHGLGVFDIWIPEVLGNTQLLGVLPGAYAGPIAAAFLVTALTEGRPGLRRWAARLFRWRIGWYWYVGIIVGVPAVLIATTALFTGGTIIAPPLIAVLAYLPLLIVQMLTTGLAEEPGWRDFALPRLQGRFGALGASLILGPVWGFWHLPLFFSEWGGWPNSTWTFPVLFMASAISITFVITYVFNRTGGSLPIVMLLHVGVNNTSSVLLPGMFPSLSSDTILLASFLAATAVAALMLVMTRGRLGYVRPTPIS